MELERVARRASDVHGAQAGFTDFEVVARISRAFHGFGAIWADFELFPYPHAQPCCLMELRAWDPDTRHAHPERRARIPR